jgi:hypothetical protein
VPETFARVTAPTAVVFTEKVAVVAPAATVTLAGTVAATLSLDNATADPPVGAGLARVTVPVEELAPVTLVGVSETEASTGGLIVRMADCVPL